MTRCRVTLLLTITLASTLLAGAQVRADPAGDCGPSNGWVFGGGGGIPDGGSTWIGPAETSGTTCIQEVAVAIDLFHPLVGDLIVRLGYDRDCDGTVDTDEVTLICRPGRGCDAGSGRGCEASASGRYTFTGAVPAGFADPCPSDAVPMGCYGVVDGSIDFGVFHGEALGGCFRLYVEDGEEGDEGFLKTFLVSYTEMICVVPTGEASWGRVKVMYAR